MGGSTNNICQLLTIFKTRPHSLYYICMKERPSATTYLKINLYFVPMA
jgi:hypothetical protein